MTQVDPPGTMLIFHSAAPDCGTADLAADSSDYLLGRERDERGGRQGSEVSGRSVDPPGTRSAYADLRERSAK